MNGLIAVAGLVVAIFGQWLNTKPYIPSLVVKLALSIIGLAFYLFVAVPAAWTGQAFLDWFDKAWLFALALPGAASLIGLAPGMKTNDGGAK